MSNSDKEEDEIITVKLRLVAGYVSFTDRLNIIQTIPAQHLVKGEFFYDEETEGCYFLLKTSRRLAVFNNVPIEEDLAKKEIH